MHADVFPSPNLPCELNILFCVLHVLFSTWILQLQPAYPNSEVCLFFCNLNFSIHHGHEGLFAFCNLPLIGVVFLVQHAKLMF